MKRLALVGAFALTQLCLPQNAQALTIATSGTWSGLDVTIFTPDKVIFGTPFEVSFLMDASPLAPDAQVAFLTSVKVDDTVGIGSAQWSYLFTNDTIPGGVSFSGLVGDSFAPLRSSGGQFVIDFFDPLADPTLSTFGFTFVGGGLHDQVLWTVSNLIIAGDTNVELVLDDDGITFAGVFDSSVLVLDPPAAVPEPSGAAMLLAGLGILGWQLTRRGKPGVRTGSAGPVPLS